MPETMKEVLADKAKAVLTSIKLYESANFFNIGGTQISSTMNNGRVHLRWNGEVVVVTSDDFPGEEKWIFPGTIAFASWSTKEGLK